MKTINPNKIEPFKFGDSSSKGNQPKWFVDGIWYKLDDMGREGLAEVLISRLLHKSNIKYPFVDYSPVQIEYKNRSCNGCESKHFLENDWILVPLEYLFKQNTGTGLSRHFRDISTVEERIKYTVDKVIEFTKLKDFGKYLTTVLEIDAFFLNEDRHTKNIVVLYNPQIRNYSYCPIFDQGSSLLLDCSWDFSMSLSIDECIERANAKPFSTNFNEQLKAAENLYGIQLQFSFESNDIFDAIEDMMEMYGDGVCVKAGLIIMKQMERYEYLMNFNY